MCDVLMIDSDAAHAQRFVLEARDAGIATAMSFAIPRAEEICAHDRPRVVFLDAALLKSDCESAIDRFSEKAPVVLMGAGDELQGLLRWVSLGACEYVAKPVDIGRVSPFLERSQQGRSLAVRCFPDSGDATSEMVVGACPGMVSAMKTAGLVARTSAPVLIRGESGTGKELLAREIHRVSGRSGSFIPLNCAAVAEGVAESELFGHERGAFTGAIGRRAGCFEQADQGTLFLDEVGDAAPGFQVKLLRALDRGEFYRVGGQTLVQSDARIVAATHCDLERAIDAEGFRLDLFYRLGAVTIALPPLRERREDLPTIVRMMLMRLNRRLGRRIRGVTREGLEWLRNYDWPGNLRELQHVIHRAVLLCWGDVIHAEHLVIDAKAEDGLARSSAVRTLAEIEEAHIHHVLDVTGGNRGRACKLLGISRPTLRRKIDRYQLGALAEGQTEVQA